MEFPSLEARGVDIKARQVVDHLALEHTPSLLFGSYSHGIQV